MRPEKPRVQLGEASKAQGLFALTLSYNQMAERALHGCLQAPARPRQAEADRHAKSGAGIR